MVHLYYMDRVKRIWHLSPMRAAKVQASLRIHAVSPVPSLLAHTSSESRGTFRQKARSLAPLNGWACAVEICHDGMLKDKNSLDGAHIWKPEYKIDHHQQKRHRCWCLYNNINSAIQMLASENYGEDIWATSWENLFLQYVNNKGTDQPAHPQSLISAFVVRCLGNIIPLVSISKFSSLYLVSAAAKAGLSLTWSKTLKSGFLRMRHLFFSIM